MAEQNSSRGIMVATIVAAIILVAVVVPFSLPGNKSAAVNDDGSVEERIKPVARFVEAPTPAPASAAPAAGEAAPAAAAAPKDGATVFNNVCTVCHTPGAAGAPKVGDKAAWAPRIAQGKETLYKSALGGKNAMPAKGGNSSLSDAEVKAAVDFMVGKSQ